jgi:PPOX class probable F420-dependent enzyme
VDVWEKLATARVATLATINPDGSPQLVPVVFAAVGHRIVTAVDGKAKTGRKLRRLSNIERDPVVSMLAHHYEEDWLRIWWVRLDGRATLLSADPEGSAALRARYPQYSTVALPGPFISIEVWSITEWSA